ncbi:MAG: nuclear transport factor 2 family protein [Actinomycetes bacterium]
MPTVEHMREVVARYTAAHSAGDVDAVAALFAEDAVVADPVDQPEHVGREAVRAFFAGTHQMCDSMDLQATGAVRAVGNWAAVPLRAVTAIGEMRLQVEIIDVFTFNDEGLISDMRAYWTAEDIRPV